MTHQPISWRTYAGALLIFFVVGFAGGFPLSLLAWIFFGGQVALDMLLLLALLVGTWLPLRFVFSDSSVPQHNWRNLLPRSVSPLVLMITSIAFTVLIPVIWAAVAPAFLLGVAIYIITGQQLLTTLLLALLANSVMIAIAAQRDDAPPVQIFSQVQTMRDNFDVQGVQTITLGEDDVQQTGSSDDADDKIRYLQDSQSASEANETHTDDAQHSNIITMPPQTDTRQDSDAE